MTDLYTQLVNNPVGRAVAGQIGLPRPAVLDRWRPGEPVIDGTVLHGGAEGGRLGEAVARSLSSIGARATTSAGSGGAASRSNGASFKALVYDATGIVASDRLRELRDFFGPVIRQLGPNGRIVVLGTPPLSVGPVREAIAQRALEGFVRSAAKEVGGRGATAQLVYVEPGAEHELESTLCFLLSPRSAYVSGQVIRIGPPVASAPFVGWEAPLSGKVAAVTGAARGIGAAIAEVLARDGAHVVGIDIPSSGGELAPLAERLDGSSLAIDITQEDAPQRIVDHLLERHGGIDVFVHNAGITRDKRLGGMDSERWDAVLGVNLIAEERLNDALLERDALRGNGRIVCVSSISGIAGNAGQANYATSKAGVIGMVQAMAPVLAERSVTINAVAPGFIETAMTAAMPFAIREAGRRMSSLSQGGLPVDVAETIAWFASPGSAGISGNVVRVCGQSLLGA